MRLIGEIIFEGMVLSDPDPKRIDRQARIIVVMRATIKLGRILERLCA